MRNETVRWVLLAVFSIWNRPSAFFDRVAVSNLVGLAVGLQLTRWLLYSGGTITHFYLAAPPTLLPIPFGMDLNDYRAMEIYACFPIGLAVMAVITYEIWLRGQRYAGLPMTFKKTWEVVALAWFAPWLPTLFLDNLLLMAGLANPPVIVPFHIIVVALESWLTAVGLQRVFAMPPNKAWRLSLWGGTVFLILYGAVVR